MARDTARGEIREVTNYIAALDNGLALLGKLPLSMRLICQIHSVLLKGVRGQERTPGEVRRSQNWIGSPDNRPDTAAFVPPPVEEMKNALSDWERFIHEDVSIPLLVKCALLHYQFETIHPFLQDEVLVCCAAVSLRDYPEVTVRVPRSLRFLARGWHGTVGGTRSHSYTLAMTTKERLHRFVDQLTDDEARSAFALLDSQFAEPVPRPLPAFVGMLNTDDPDLAARSSEILRAEFGRS